MTCRVLIAGGGTGGHLMPALALAEGLSGAHPDWSIHLAGASRGLEAVVLPTRPFPYTLLSTQPIYRRQWWRNLLWATALPRVVWETRSLLNQVQPTLVIGTGGYASAPVLYWASRRGIPTAIQEQNAYPGVATRWLAGRVRHIYLGVPEARGYLQPGKNTKVFDTGTPVAPPDRARRPVAAEGFGLDLSRPVLLVSGGSQGAIKINQLVAEWLTHGGGAEIQMLWSTGRGSYTEFARFHDPPAVTVKDFIDPMADAWAIASLALTRAGMMTIAEAMAWGVPLVMVPLPGAASDHQTANAEVVARAGAGVLLHQQEATSDRLGAKLEGLLRDREGLSEMASRALARGRPEAGRRILEHLTDLLS